MASNASFSGLSPSTQPNINIFMSAQQVVVACESVPADTKIIASITSDDGEPPLSPDAPNPPMFGQNEDFLPTPCFVVESKKDALDIELRRSCLQHPIVIIRNLSSILELDLGLFSTKTLFESNPNQRIETRIQTFQLSDKNYDAGLGRHVWLCKSSGGHTTIANYANYQSKTFNSFHNDPLSQLHKPIKFGTNVDLSDDTKWKPQLRELKKLPDFLRVDLSDDNMLNHVGHPIYGVNTVQLYMKVPGCRTPAHQENNNFCSVNINIGPGDCEWFGVAQEYWGLINQLCEKNGTNFFHGAWWPLQEDLKEAKVPFYKFAQKPGDLVWVSPGTIHWVQSSGWCNNIAWNVGPLTAQQFELAVNRYDWNRVKQYKSIVPMVHLTWNMADKIEAFDPNLLIRIKTVLLRSLKHCIMVSNCVKALGREIQLHERGKNEPSHYCTNCDVEVFYMLFVKQGNHKHEVHCFECARMVMPKLYGFDILEERKMLELTSTYDKLTSRGNQDDQDNDQQDDQDADMADGGDLTAAAPIATEAYMCGDKCQQSHHSGPAEHNLRYHQGLKTFGCGYEADGQKCTFQARLAKDVTRHLKGRDGHRLKTESLIRTLVVDLLSKDNEQLTNETHNK